MLQTINEIAQKIKYAASVLAWFADSLATFPTPPKKATGNGSNQVATDPKPDAAKVEV